MSDDDLRKKLKPYLAKKAEEHDPVIDEFLQRVYYRSGMYSIYEAAADNVVIDFLLPKCLW